MWGDQLEQSEAQAVWDAQQLEAVVAYEVKIRRLLAAQARKIAELEAAGVARRSGYGSMQRLLSVKLLISHAEARARIAAAEATGPRRSLTGERLPARCPATAEAFAAGEVSLAAVRLIAQTMTMLPPGVHPGDAATAEVTLAEHAKTFEPRALGRLCERVRAHLDPDGPEPTEPPEPERELHLHPRMDGGVRLHAVLDAEGAAALRTVLGALNRRRPDTDGAGPDQRPLARRNADALIEACHRLLDAGQLPPTNGGQRPQLIVTMDWDALREAAGTATLDHASPIGPATARRIACDSGVIPVVLGGDGQPLDVGKARRTAGTALRHALTIRDRGCAFPGCDTSPQYCTAHHLRHWADGGPTALNNLVLLCRYHHYLVHHSGWQVRIRDHRAEFIPPALIDRERKPRHNPLRQ